MGLLAIASLMTNPLIALVILLGMALNVWYIYAVENRIAFASANLNVACVSLLKHKSIIVVAILLLLVQMGWMLAWTLGTLGT